MLLWSDGIRTLKSLSLMLPLLWLGSGTALGQSHYPQAYPPPHRSVPQAPTPEQWTSVQIPAAALADGGEVKSLLASGIELEREKAWGDAIHHYKDALRQFPRHPQIEQRLLIAKTHYDLDRRYADSSYVGLVNRLDNANRIRVGQELKLVRGPFHAVVDKSDYRLDLFHGPPDNDDAWMFVRSFDVGLGEDDSTPTGRFVVRENGKLQNPGWVNPRDPSERYEPDDPQNPVGEYWIGIDGLGEDAVYTGYGLHGTIEPATIGQQRSMGCVRLLPDDIALLYETLAGGVSRVRITE